MFRKKMILKSFSKNQNNSSMEYDEYPVRCFGCYETVAARADEYHNLLLTGMSIMEALDTMDVQEECTRNAFMNPSKVFFNVQNDDAVNGYIDLRNYKSFVPKKKIKEVQIRYIVNQITDFPLKVPAIRPIMNLPPTDIIEIKTQQKEFIYPKYPGIPTFNSDSTVEKDTIYVGSDRRVDVLTGRTYLAR